MTLDKLANSNFVSRLSFKNLTDYEFWQYLGWLADNIISLTSKARGQLVEIVIFGQVWCTIRASPERAQTINDFDPIWPHINVKYFCPHGLRPQSDMIFECGWPHMRRWRPYWPQNLENGNGLFWYFWSAKGFSTWFCKKIITFFVN